MNIRNRQISMAVLAVVAAVAVLVLWGARGMLPAAWANGGGGGTSYVLTLEIHGQGTVKLDPPNQTYSGDTSRAYAKDTPVTLTATPASGWYFDRWEGDVSGSGFTRTITMTSNKMAVAIFKQPTITVHKQGTGQVQVYLQGSPPGETLTPTFSRTFPVNVSVVLIAHPPAGWAFVKWTGDASGTSPSKIIGMSADKTVTAVFEPIKLTVSMDPAGAGSVNVTPPNQTDDEPFTVTFAGAINTQQVSATAYPNVGWAFKEWTGDHTGTDNPATIDVNGEEEVTAVFEEVELTVDTEGKGVVHIDPPDITPEEEEYPHTEKYASADPQDPPEVLLTASPTDANWGFKEWTGDVEPPADAAAIAVVMDAAKSVTAVFDQVEVTITVEGNGNVSTAPVGEVISETKKGFAYGAEVAFTATADPGWAFKEWSGAITGAEATTTSEPILEDASVTALFEQIELTVDTQGTGKVTISPPVVTPEVEEYPHTEVYPLSTLENPQSVTLTAVEVANWGFKEWTGDVEGPANLTTTQVEMDAAKTVTAVFEQAVLSMNVEGEGSIGTSPAGEVLSATRKGFRPGDPNVEDPITIEAFPGAEWGFEKWTGAINTTDNPAPIEMDSDQSVTAVFYQNTLTVTSGGQGQVSTGGEPRTPTFTEDFKPGKQVNLEAHPEDGWFFAGWSGAVTSASSTAPVTMTEDKTVHALFERIELSVEKQGQGTVTASPPGGQVSVPFTEGYTANQQVALSATAAPGWGFKQWIGEVTPSGATATVTMNRAKTVTAVFAQATLDVDKEGEGTVSVSPPGGVQVLPFSETYPYNALVSLAVNPDCGWIFDHWEGDISPPYKRYDNPLELPMNDNKEIIGVFAPDRPYVIVLGGEFANAPGPEDEPPFENGLFDWAYGLDSNKYDVHMYDEDGVDEYGNGYVLDRLIQDINASDHPLRIVMTGHSHGGGSVKDLCQGLVAAMANDEISKPFQIILTMYVDAVATGSTLPEGLRPAGSLHHVNLYQNISDGLPDGMTIYNSTPDWDVNQTLNCVSGVNHTAIDSCSVVHNILTDHLEFHAYCKVLEEDYCDDDVACNDE